MKLHRFFVGKDIELTRKLWVHELRLINQWTRVLRFRPGDELVLFNGTEERLYKIIKIEPFSVGLELVTEMVPTYPERDIYVLWALLKSDKNDLVIQKCTEIGANHFIPLVTERTEKTGFDEERAAKIAIEAAEQCGRGNVPDIREPIGLEAAIHELKDKITLLIAEQTDASTETAHPENRPFAVLIGPEGGWSDEEKQLFVHHDLPKIGLGNFTLRAETAAIAAAFKMMNSTN